MLYEVNLRKFEELDEEEKLYFSEVYQWFYNCTKGRFRRLIKDEGADVFDLLKELDSPSFEVKNNFWDLSTCTEFWVRRQIDKPTEEFRFILATARLAATLAAASETIESDFDKLYPELKIKELKKL